MNSLLLQGYGGCWVIRLLFIVSSKTDYMRVSVCEKGQKVVVYFFVFACDVTAAILVHRTMQQNVFWEFDYIIMQNSWEYFLLFGCLISGMKTKNKCKVFKICIIMQIINMMTSHL